MRYLLQTLSWALRSRQLMRYGLLAGLTAVAGPALASGVTPPAAVVAAPVTALPVLYGVMPNAAAPNATISLSGSNLTGTMSIFFRSSLGDSLRQQFLAMW